MPPVNQEMLVGAPMPWPAPPHEATALTLMSLSSLELVVGGRTHKVYEYANQPAFMIWLDGDVSREVSDLNGLCVAMGYYRSKEFPCGFPMFIFESETRQGQWLIKAPFIADQRDLLLWASRPTDILWFFLMERATKRLRVIRQLPIPEELKAYMVDAIRSNPRPASPLAYGQFVEKYSEEAIWKASIQWYWNPETDTFEH